MIQISVPELNELKQMIREALLEILEERFPNMITDKRDYYTREEVAAKWQVSHTTIWRYVKWGWLHPISRGKSVRFSKEEIDSLKGFDISGPKRRPSKAEKNMNKKKKDEKDPTQPPPRGGDENSSQNKK